MLGDAKLDYLDTRLEQFKLSNQTSQNELQVFILLTWSHAYHKSRANANY